MALARDDSSTTRTVTPLSPVRECSEFWERYTPCSTVPPRGRSAKAVVDVRFCLPDFVNLIFTPKAITPGVDFIITDVKGNVKLKAKVSGEKNNDRLTLFDDTDKLIVTIRKKVRFSYSKWEAFMGDSTDSKDLLFVLQKCSSSEFDVALASKYGREHFKITGSYVGRSCVISIGSSDTKIAEMIVAKDPCDCRVYPDEDYAFVGSLIVILNQIEYDL